jgi:hypothetical protein
MWRFSKRRSRPPLSERICYVRLYGERSDAVELLSRGAPSTADRAAPDPPSASPSGPASVEPALHLVLPYSRGASSVSGEDLRLDLLARMRARRAHERVEDVRRQPE